MNKQLKKQLKKQEKLFDALEKARKNSGKKKGDFLEEICDKNTYNKLDYNNAKNKDKEPIELRNETLKAFYSLLDQYNKEYLNKLKIKSSDEFVNYYNKKEEPFFNYEFKMQLKKMFRIIMPIMLVGVFMWMICIIAGLIFENGSYFSMLFCIGAESFALIAVACGVGIAFYPMKEMRA